MSKTRVMIVDDHALVREGIAAFLKMSSDIEVVGEAADGIEAIEGVKKLNPDIVIMDIAMPKLGGLEALVEIKKINPDAKVLVLTQYEDKEYIKRFLKAGASGYMLKRAVGLDLLNAIKAISSGEAYLHPSIAASVIDEYVGGNKNEASEDLYEALTDREKQVLKLIAEGHTSKEIADILGISAKTAVAHQTNLSEKLDIHTRAGLIKFAITKGLIKL
ncbi:MAG: two component LuxR family transcriptional regulator [Nitrospirae bacterium]|nr:MAG: two component LuxR family transcriptional regulator [Nitrospirota bacterium]